MLVDVAAVTRPNVSEIVAWLFVRSVSKFVPVTVRVLPAAARAGVKLAIVGAIAP